MKPSFSAALAGALLFGAAACNRGAPPAPSAAPSASVAPSAEPPAASSAPAASAAPSAAPTPSAPKAPLPLPPTPKDLQGPPKDAVKTPSGLAYVKLASGTGTKTPAVADNVVAHYAGWTKNGKPYDSSYGRGEPSTFRVGGVVLGWSEGLQLMHEGDRFRFWIPSKLAYGEKPPRGIPAGMLILEVELLAIQPAPPPPSEAKP